MGSIYARKRNGTTYYVYQEARRVKIDPSAREKPRVPARARCAQRLPILAQQRKYSMPFRKKGNRLVYLFGSLDS